MFKTKFPQFFSAVLFLLVFSVISLNAQVPEHEIPALKKQAIEAFETGDYLVAEVGFDRLMRHYPRDPMYRYYAGICKVEMNKELEQAVELLYYASTRGVPEDVYFYLGEAYRKLYDFKRAKRYYIKFDKEAPRSMAKEKNSKLLIRSVVSAMQITATYNPLELLNVTFVNMEDPVQYGQIKMRGGILTKKPEEFFSEKEDKNDLNSLMFMPKKVERGQYVYFAGLTKNGKNGFQIMQARKGNTGKWVDIEAIDALNTELNEILPYFDPVGRDIYFASDGHEGLGGFDLYRSHYDEERKQWSDPVSLGFPVNSVYDDYLLLPGTDLGMVMFFSARQASDTAVTVYRVQLIEPKQSLATSTPLEIRRIANLGDVAADALNEYKAYQALLDKAEQSKQSTDEVKEKTMAATEQKENGVSDKKYQELIANALQHQSVSDSLTELASAARVKVHDSKDPNDRWIYQKQIMVWEKRAMEEQGKADEIFATIDTYKKEESTEAIKKDTVINEITVYKFVVQDSINQKAKNVFQQSAPKAEPDVLQEKVAEKVIRKDIADTEVIAKKEVHQICRFEILSSSPYSSDNPIPENTLLPDGSFYRIQLGVFSKKVLPDAFGGLTPITAETIPERNLTKYYVGKFSRYEDAHHALAKVRASGYQDAYIVSWYKGGKMSVEKVKKLENLSNEGRD